MRSVREFVNKTSLTVVEIKAGEFISEEVNLNGQRILAICFPPEWASRYATFLAKFNGENKLCRICNEEGNEYILEPREGFITFLQGHALDGVNYVQIISGTIERPITVTNNVKVRFITSAI